MHTGTENNIKAPIEALFSEEEFQRKLVRQVQSPRERILSGTNFRSDFAFETTDGGWFFVEDDDPQRALGNFIKYWFWAEHHEIHSYISLVHLIGRCDPGPTQILEFMQEKAHRALPHFQSIFVFTDSWETEAWIHKFRAAVISLRPFNNHSPEPGGPRSD